MAQQIENIIAQRIKEIQDKLDESYYKIKNGEIALLLGSQPPYRHATLQHDDAFLLSTI